MDVTARIRAWVQGHEALACAAESLRRAQLHVDKLGVSELSRTVVEARQRVALAMTKITDVED